MSEHIKYLALELIRALEEEGHQLDDESGIKRGTIIGSKTVNITINDYMYSNPELYVENVLTGLKYEFELDQSEF